MARPIVFLSDYGFEDEFVGVCKGVIARAAADARVIDLSHSIPEQDVVTGAVVLAQNVRFMPDDAVYLAIVDPDVGSDRLALAVETRSGAVLVGRDNGLLSLAWEALGGAERAVEISSSHHVLEPVSPTFHGRDVFAPAAAHLASGGSLSDLGPECQVDTLARVSVPAPAVDEGRIRCVVFSVDRFGNLQLNARPADLDAAGLGAEKELEVSAEWGSWSVRRVTTFSDVGPHDLALVVDSAGFLSVIVNQGSAALALGLRRRDDVNLARLLG